MMPGLVWERWGHCSSYLGVLAFVDKFGVFPKVCPKVLTFVADAPRIKVVEGL